MQLGTYSFAAGSEALVTLSNEAVGQAVVADAVRFVLDQGEPPTDPILSVMTVDNQDALFTETWSISTQAAGFFASNYHGIATGNGEATATWQPELPYAGTYEVYARWTAHAKRATHAPYTILHAEGDETVVVDQTQNGGEWVRLGTYLFAAGTEGLVTLSNDSPGNWVVADAVQFTLIEINQDPNQPLPEEYPEPADETEEPPAPPTEENPSIPDVELVVDNHDATFDGPWQASSQLAGFIGDNYHGTATGSGEATATWQPELSGAGTYEVFARWTSHSKRATEAPYTIVHQDGEATVVVDQTQNGGTWVSLGTYAFAAGVSGRVTLSNDSSGNWVVADAIRFVLVTASVERVVDNIDATFVGSWQVSDRLVGFFGDNYHGTATGGGEATATWQPELPEAGTYEVFARWTSHSKRAKEAPYTIVHQDGEATVVVDQTQNGGTWVSLGTYAFTAGDSGRVRLSNDSSGNWVVADAIRFELK